MSGGGHGGYTSLLRRYAAEGMGDKLVGAVYECGGCIRSMMEDKDTEQVCRRRLTTA
jgi:hypothetical protein